MTTKKKKRDCFQMIDGRQTDTRIHSEINNPKDDKKLVDRINELYRTR